MGMAELLLAQKSSYDFSDAVYGTDGIEVNIFDSMPVKVANLTGRPFNAKLACFVITGAMSGQSCQFFWDVAMEGLWYHRKLGELGERLYAWNNWYGNTHRTGFVEELVEFPVVVEKLCNGIFGSQVLLLLQESHVLLQVWSFLVFLRVCSDAEVERIARVLDGSTVDEEAFVELIDLLYQLRGVGIASLSRLEALVLTGFVATQEHEVVNAENLKVYELILDALGSSTGTDDVRAYWYAVALLYGSSNGNGAGATTNALPFQQTVLSLVVNKLTVMGGDVYEEGIEFFQLVYRAEQCFSAVAFQRRQNLEREMSSFIVF